MMPLDREKAPTQGEKIREKMEQTGLRKKAGKKVLRSLRLDPDDWDRLAVHFEGIGLGISAGLRMVIREYMRKEGLR